MKGETEEDLPYPHPQTQTKSSHKVKKKKITHDSEKDISKKSYAKQYLF